MFGERADDERSPVDRSHLIRQVSISPARYRVGTDGPLGRPWNNVRALKVFVAGATGVLGRSAVAALVAAGHQVTGTARTAGGAALLRAAGAEPTNPDLFDPHSVTFAVAGHDVVCNFATKIPGPSGYFRRSAWAANDRLHAEASRHLVDAPLVPPPHGHSIKEAERQAARFTEAGRTGIMRTSSIFER